MIGSGAGGARRRGRTALPAVLVALSVPLVAPGAASLAAQGRADPPPLIAPAGRAAAAAGAPATGTPAVPAGAAPAAVDMPPLPAAVLAPGFTVASRTAADWSVAWWQWAMADFRRSPLRDLTGRRCAVDQEGPVWFLAPTAASTTARKRCAVPAGRHLFFPVFQVARWPVSASEPLTCDQARSQATVPADDSLQLRLEIDGVAVSGLERYRAASDGCFPLFARVPEARRVTDGAPAASDGYWLMLAPLPPGEHLIRFSARRRRDGGAPKVVHDTEYTITVSAGNAAPGNPRAL